MKNHQLNDFIKGIECKSLSSFNEKGESFFPPEITIKIQESMANVSLFHKRANTLNLESGNSIEIFQIKNLNACEWYSGVEPIKSDEEKNDKWSATRINTHTLSATYRISKELLDDATFNVGQEIEKLILNIVVEQELKGFLYGNGEKKPMGLLTKITEITLPKDKILDTLMEIRGKIQITNETAWFVSPTILSKFFNSIRDCFFNSFSQFLGIPIFILPELKEGTGFLTDLKQSYTIVRRQNIEFLKDPYSCHPYVNLIVSERVGGAPFYGLPSNPTIIAFKAA